MPTYAPTFPPRLLALVPGAAEALKAHTAATAAVGEKQAAIRAHSHTLLAARSDVTLPAAKLDAIELKHEALYREEASAKKAFDRTWERYAAVVNAHRNTEDFQGAVVQALPEFDQAARTAWAAFEAAFWEREQAYELLGSPAPEHHYLLKLASVGHVLGAHPHLDKVGGFVEKFPSQDVIQAALVRRAEGRRSRAEAAAALAATATAKAAS